MRKSRSRRHLFAFAVAVVLAVGALGPGARPAAAELPEVIGPFLRGRAPRPGMWLEYRLALPRDPLEARLEREARAAAREENRLRLEALAAADNDGGKDARPSPCPPPSAPVRRAAAPGGGDPDAIDLAPPDAPAPSWTVEPLRLDVRTVAKGRIGLRLYTLGGVYDLDLPFDEGVPPFAASAASTSPAAGVPPDPVGESVTSPSSAPREWTTRVDGRDLAVRIFPLVPSPPEPSADAKINADGVPAAAAASVAPGRDGEGKGEVWVQDTVPFGLVRVRAPSFDLALAGYGEGGAPGFPLPRPDLPEGFPNAAE